MTNPDTPAAPMVEIWRGPFLESVHAGHAVVCDDTGQIVHTWGDPDAVILPRSSAKMIQGLPLITSASADTDATFDAVQTALARLSDEDKQALSLKGLVKIAKADYLAVPNPPGTLR